METETRTSFYPWPFLEFLQVLGVVSYRTTNSGTFQMSSALSIYSAIGVALLAHIRIDYCYIMKVRIDDFFTFVFVILHSVVNHIVVILEFFIVWVKNPKLCLLAAKIINYRDSLRRPTSKKTTYLAWMVAFLGFCQFFLYLHSFLVKNVSALGKCSWFFSIFNFYSLVIDILILFYIGNVEAVFSDVNQELSLLHTSYKNLEIVSRMRNLRITHCEALDIMCDFNSCFGPVTLISSFKEFVVFVCTPFYALVSPSKVLGYQEYVVWFSRYFFNYLAKLILFTLTHKQVNQKFLLQTKQFSFIFFQYLWRIPVLENTKSRSV
ncbi:hypothetical protein RUM43_000160 [Polyplax serrata]|uniref:Gustatory receptor n=1 Tax=Polyplax serrata TaxID=468196 RepID=A0AAN8SGD1_POLSC